MKRPVKATKRGYSSPVRQEQAAQTRRRILDAADTLFVERGYARTTVRDIASSAGVAADTVYAAFGSKARILTALIDRRLVPDDSVANVTERPDVQAVRDEPDQVRQFTMFAESITAISTNLRPVFEVLRTASAVEPEMANVLREMERYRLHNMRQFAGWIAGHGPLRVDAEQAAAILWTLASPDVGRLLCDELGWSQTEHAEWLADTLVRTLLPDNGARRASTPRSRGRRRTSPE